MSNSDNKEHLQHLIGDDYQLQWIIGHGGMSTVWPQNLEGNLAVAMDVVSEPHSRQAAVADNPQQLVVVADEMLEMLFII